MSVLDGLVNKEVIVWMRRGEGVSLCRNDANEGMVPAMITVSGEGSQPMIMPFVKGTVKQVGDRYALRYTMPDHSAWFLFLNEDAILSVTMIDPESVQKKSSLIVGVS